MKIKLNENKEVVDTVKEGLERTGGYCPCMLAKNEDTKCMCKDFREKLPTPITRAIATVCFIIRKNKYTKKPLESSSSGFTFFIFLSVRLILLRLLGFR